MRPTSITSCLIASLWLGAVSADAPKAERWRILPDVGLLTNVAVRMHWFASAEQLRAASAQSGQAISEVGLHGFSILRRNSQTGDYVCDIYVVKMTGAHVDGDRTTTFGHEILHCFGLKHE